jgi:hypothetical protein
MTWHRDHGRARLFRWELPNKSWESNWRVSKFSLFWITPAHYGPTPVSSGRSLVECSKASANSGEFPSTAVKLSSIVLRRWFRLIRWPSAVISSAIQTKKMKLFRYSRLGPIYSMLM